mmetsp:Transcript_31953/g.63289  ORF Transcript_31953/g.63289 Transcript_31953/m.63289 type:complete len:211 (-) Transcript_31953:288-920(-)
MFVNDRQIETCRGVPHIATLLQELNGSLWIARNFQIIDVPLLPGAGNTRPPQQHPPELKATHRLAVHTRAPEQVYGRRGIPLHPLALQLQHREMVTARSVFSTACPGEVFRSFGVTLGNDVGLLSTEGQLAQVETGRGIALCPVTHIHAAWRNVIRSGVITRQFEQSGGLPPLVQYYALELGEVSTRRSWPRSVCTISVIGCNTFGVYGV